MFFFNGVVGTEGILVAIFIPDLNSTNYVASPKLTNSQNLICVCETDSCRDGQG